MSDVLLEAKNVTIQFGGLKAVDNFNLTLKANQLAGLIGPNGAGKTTVFNLLTGVYKPSLGSISLDGQRIDGKKSYQINQAGLSRTFQNIRLFKELSVLDNVLTASSPRMKYSILEPLVQTAKFQRLEQEAKEQALSLLKIFSLDTKADTAAGSLPYGEQRKLEIIRSLATQPKILLLDEPAAGMNHSETHSLMETISQIREQFNLAVLLIEHDMKLVMGICERITVLDHGVKIAEGTPQEIQNCPKVIAAYLGTPLEETPS